MRSENQEGLPSHPPKRTNGADRLSDQEGRRFSFLHASLVFLRLRALNL